MFWKLTYQKGIYDAVKNIYSTIHKMQIISTIIHEEQITNYRT